MSIWELLKSTQNSHSAPFYGNKTHRTFVTFLLISHKLCRAYPPVIFTESVLGRCDLRKKKHFQRLAQINGRGEVISVTAPSSSWSAWQLQQQDGLPEIRQHAFLLFLALKGRNCSWWDWWELVGLVGTAARPQGKAASGTSNTAILPSMRGGSPEAAQGNEESSTSLPSPFNRDSLEKSCWWTQPPAVISHNSSWVITVNWQRCLWLWLEYLL